MTTKKVERRIKIKYRIRKSVFGTAERPRMSVFRSNKQIYVQVINDLEGKRLQQHRRSASRLCRRLSRPPRWVS